MTFINFNSITKSMAPLPFFSFLNKKKRSFPARKPRKNETYEKVEKAQRQINKYLSDSFFPLVKKHINDEYVVKVVDGEILNECEESIEKLVGDLQNLNVRKKINEVLEENGLFSEQNHRQNKEELKNYVEEYLQAVDESIEEMFVKDTITKEDTKCKLKQSVYNFTDYKLSEEQIKVLLLGKNAVVRCGEEYEIAGKRFFAELKSYLTGYADSYEDCKANTDKINEENVVQWLEEAIKIEVSARHLSFFRNILERIPFALENIRRNCNENSEGLKDKRTLIEMLNIPGCIILEADKNYGMALIKITDLMKADKETMQKMRAVCIESSEEECMEQVRIKIELFEANLTEEQKLFLDKINPKRKISKDECQFPMLKNTPKIHKMKEEDLEKGDPASLTFRPVFAAESWILRPYNLVLMNILRQLNSDFEKTFPHKVMVKNGSAAAKKIQNWNTKECDGKTIVAATADLSDAYTNVDIEMLVKAVKNIAQYMKLSQYQTEAIIELAKLVLKNNYIKTTNGCFLLGAVLPMGNSMSGDGLDTVSLDCEFKNIFSNEGLISQSDIEIVDYLRYKDDTLAPFICDPEDIRKFLIRYAKIFPSKIPLNIGLSGMGAKFLDVFFWRRFSSGKMVTTVARNFSMPPKYLKKESMVPPSLKMCVSYSEVYRF